MKKYNYFERTHIMGILNVTPDSFSDGGRYFSFDSAVDRGVKLAEEGADILDVGGESSRPGALAVSAEEEERRVIPVIKALSQRIGIPISVDTYKSAVAEKALQAGASIINDISGLKADPRMAEVAARYDVPVVIMHMKGMPDTMQEKVEYEDVVSEIASYFEERVKYAESRGIKKENIIIDPGIGFGKFVRHNLKILGGLSSLKRFNLPVLVGTSRKSMIGHILNVPPDKRLEGDLACVAASIVGGANIVRVHDVAEVKRFLTVFEAILSDSSYKRY